MKELFDNLLAKKIRKELQAFEPNDIPKGWQNIQSKLPQKNTGFQYPLFKSTAIGFVLLVAVVIPLNQFQPSESFLNDPFKLSLLKADKEAIKIKATDHLKQDSNSGEPTKEKRVTIASKSSISKSLNNQTLIAENADSLEENDNRISEIQTSRRVITLARNNKDVLGEIVLQKIIPKKIYTIEAKKTGQELKNNNMLPINEDKKKRKLIKPGSWSFTLNPSVQYNRTTDFYAPAGGFGLLFHSKNFGNWEFASGVLLSGIKAKEIANPFEFTANELDGLVLADVSQGPNAKEPPRKVELVTVEASIWSIEIPIQVRYFIKKSSQFLIFVEGSASSYFNGQEYYFYDEELFEVPANLKLPAIELLDFERKYENLASINWMANAQIGIGFEKKLKGKKSFVAVPFFNLPISPIGVEHIESRSFGLKLQYNFLMK